MVHTECKTENSNFSFLQQHDSIFLQLAQSAERAFSSDPNTTLIKLRQLGEAFAQDIAARSGLEFDERTSQSDLLYRLNREVGLDRVVSNLFHTLRVEGNKATHQFRTRHKEALDGLKVARELAVWFHRSFGTHTSNFRVGAFIPLQDPSLHLRELQEQIEKLRNQLTETNEQLDSSQQLAQLLASEKEEYAVLAEQMDVEARQLTEQSSSNEAAHAEQLKAFEQRIADLQTELSQLDTKRSTARKKEIGRNTRKASQQISLSEELTRILIDQQLEEAGWLADTQELTYQKGCRPEKGVNKAIAEWPTRYRGELGRADYVLFCGLTPIAVVEAKKENTNVAGKIPQAER